MAKDFLTGAGCVVRVKGSSSNAAYKIDGWPTGLMGHSLITIDSINPVEQDIAHPVVAVDNHRALYKFGKNFGQITVRGTVYLGPSRGAAGADVLGQVSNAFDKLRLASKGKPVNVSITSGYKCKAYFTSMGFGEADPNVNKVAYVLNGIVTPNS